MQTNNNKNPNQSIFKKKKKENKMVWYYHMAIDADNQCKKSEKKIVKVLVLFEFILV